MNAKQLLEATRSTGRFRQPENFDKADEGAGWVLYTGGNDWEDCATAVAVLFPSDEKNQRVWFTIKFDKEPTESKVKDFEPLRAHAKKARLAWVRAAKRVHKDDHEGSRSWRSWLDAFKTALSSSEMKPFVDEWGVDATEWKPVSESVVRRVTGKV
jgi:hypothetical protein